MKKVISVLIVCLMLVALAACGANTPDKYVGKYVGVAAEVWGVALEGDSVTSMSLELSAGGSGKFVDGEDTTEIKWFEKDGKLIISVESYENSTTLGEDTITIDDYLGIGAKYVFAKEGSAAADPSLYITLSEEEAAMVGDWTSFAVYDILDEDLSDEYYEDAIELKINKDRTYTLLITGEEAESGNWNSLGTWGYGEDTEYDLSWDLLDDGNLKVTVELDEEDGSIYFTCSK